LAAGGPERAGGEEGSIVQQAHDDLTQARADLAQAAAHFLALRGAPARRTTQRDVDLEFALLIAV
jgi:hypothetical protein